MTKVSAVDFIALLELTCNGKNSSAPIITNAASNITGVLTNTNSFSAVLHKYGALAFWDYATAGQPHNGLLPV